MKIFLLVFGVSALAQAEASQFVTGENLHIVLGSINSAALAVLIYRINDLGKRFSGMEAREMKRLETAAEEAVRKAHSIIAKAEAAKSGM